MVKRPGCEKVGLKKGSWTPEEDHKLVSYIQQHGRGGWRDLPSKAGLQRCGKSCRLRWTNYLRPDIKRGKFNAEEEQTIIRLHALLGNRWSEIANHLPKRTDNEIKNYWNTHIKKRLIKMGIDPITHRRRIATFGISPIKDVTSVNHMAQWEIARLEAEARLMREAKIVSGPKQLVQKNYSAQLVDRSKLSRLIPPHPLCLDVLKAWQGIMLSNDSSQITLDSPTSTLNFSNNIPALPYVGFVDNQCMSMVNYVTGMPNQGVIMEQNIQKDSKILGSNFVPEMIKEKAMEKSTELDEMVYTNNVFPEGFTELIEVASMHNNLTENNIYLDENWDNILNNLADFSPLGSVF